jgi:Zn-dependent peptidase ImmA (M78 family)/DNA-binding XRE family transcriptional regulator
MAMDYFEEDTHTEDPMQKTIAKRLKAARESAGLTQRKLADQLGFKDRQTVGAMEAGERKISAEELLAVMNALGRDLEYFTDPFRLDGEGHFSWRTSVDNEDRIAEFESLAGRWLATYRNLASDDTIRTAPLQLNLTARSSYEDAHRAADWLASEWQLGDIPAEALEEAVRSRLRALVLFVDAPEEISGAAVRLSEFSAILINRNETTGRRNFDLAHELFHLLTWETITPPHAEQSGLLNPAKRAEQLANCFASGLLMPEDAVRTLWKQAPEREHRSEWVGWVAETASQFRVSVPALQWRLVQLGMLGKDAVQATEVVRAEFDPDKKPRRFAEDFVTVVCKAIDEGRISVRRASSLLGLSIDDLATIFREYSLEVPFDV